MAATARLTLCLKSGKQLTGVPVSFSGLTVSNFSCIFTLRPHFSILTPQPQQGKDRNQLVLWLEGTQSDVVFLDITSIESLVRSQSSEFLI